MHNKPNISEIIPGQDMNIGHGFRAKHFDEDSFNSLIDPVVMLDHFHMSAPTFAPHPHAGISAVTYLFEDSTGPHINYDSLGNNIPIYPGDIHWFVAGRGAVHNEQPEDDNSHVHALQIFINLPASKKMIAPYAVHADAADIPEYLAHGIRVRVVTGEYRGLRSPAVLPEPFTLLDVFLSADTIFEYSLPAGWNAFVYCVQGAVSLSADTDTYSDLLILKETNAVGIGGDATSLRLATENIAHFVILSGPSLNEPLLKHGPFVMNTQEQMNQTITNFKNGIFGQITG